MSQELESDEVVAALQSAGATVDDSTPTAVPLFSVAGGPSDSNTY